MRAIKYLDPKNDLTFRKIFGEHPNIMKSFLNSILPLEPNRHITELVYQDTAMLPELPELKHSIVDVRCTDNFGRQFIVEMQMYWTTSFKSRMLFNAGKAYIKQIDKGHKYNELCPVYGLSLVNDIFLTEDEYKNQFYHHYRLAHHEIPDEIITGIELIFIELPKFTAKTFTERKVRNLWLRFLTEIDENTKEVHTDLFSEQAITEALEQLQVSAFTKKELAYYEKYWDGVRIERTALQDVIDKSKIKITEAQKREKEAQKREKEAQKREKEAQKREKEAQKREKKIQNKLTKAINKMYKRGFTISEIAIDFEISETKVKQILKI